MASAMPGMKVRASRNRVAEVARSGSGAAAIIEELTTTFRITGLAPKPFQPLFGLSDAELARRGIKRCVADQTWGFPSRIEMRDGSLGETFLLLNHLCQPTGTPYRTTHAIYVREGAETTYDAVDQVLKVVRMFMFSLRAFDARRGRTRVSCGDFLERFRWRPPHTIYLGCRYRPDRQSKPMQARYRVEGWHDAATEADLRGTGELGSAEAQLLLLTRGPASGQGRGRPGLQSKRSHGVGHAAK